MSMNKKRLLLGSTVLAVLATGPVMAADLPAAAPGYRGPAVAPVANWTGFYLGGNVGYSFGSSNLNLGSITSPPPPITPLLTATTDLSVKGALGGLQLGYNWQFNPNWVWGVEGDFQWAGQKGQASVANLIVIPVLASVESKLDWFSTVRGRLGYVTGNSLWYVTGGWAYGHRELNVTTSAGIPSFAVGTLNMSQNKSGWTLGGGVETKLWDSNWSGKLEYLYLDLGTMTTTTTALNIAPPVVPILGTSTSATLRDHIVRVGLNYQFR
jgi:outer membrane immunogenic protein